MRKKQSLRDVWEHNKMIFTSMITIFVLFFLTGFIHELGHIVVCVSNGFDYQFYFGQLAMNVHCSDTPQPIWLYFALGGIFGLVFSLVLFSIPIVRKNKGIFIGVSVVAFDHLLKTYFETFWHERYLSDNTTYILMSILLISFWGCLFFIFHHKSKKIS